jgi:dihydroorotate dehydrogenase
VCSYKKDNFQEVSGDYNMVSTSGLYNTNMELRKPAPLFSKPLLNAAGSLGFAPNPHSGMPWDEFGAFVTNPISHRKRKPARGERMLAFPGGILLHTGHANPGFSKALKRFRSRWTNAPLPVIVHLLATAPNEMQRMIVKLETVENVIGVEVGFPADISAKEVSEILSAATGELELIARVPLPRAVELAPALIEAGASAVCLGPPRGALQNKEGAMSSGRVYGPSVFPQAMFATRELAYMGAPVIARGGVYSIEQVEALQAAGALAVQVDTALWRGDWLEQEE